MYENDMCYFFRKPHNIASSWGKEACFLDTLFGENSQKDSTTDTEDILGSNSLFPSLKNTLKSKIVELGITSVNIKDQFEALALLEKQFNSDQEYGLLNRLDTPTAGFLYFAKTPEVYAQRKDRQGLGRIQKHYLAVVEGTPETQTIDIPLGHHKNNKRMLVLDEDFLGSRRKQKMRGKPLFADTKIAKTQDLDTSTECKKNVKYSLLHLQIRKGQRHQIRAHLSHVGHPIIGEELYIKLDRLSKNTEEASKKENLQLYSLGCTFD